MGLYRDNGKENGNYYNRIRCLGWVQGLEIRDVLFIAFSVRRSLGRSPNFGLAV